MFKGRLTPALRQIRLRWQRAYYDHRLRPKEDCLPVFFYIFLNPYRAGLVQPDQTWPGYSCTGNGWRRFGGLSASPWPFPEWLR
jgi:hypothetical protein